MPSHQQKAIEETIKHLLISQLEIHPTLVAESDSTTPLLGRGIGLDSMETLTLVAGLEEAFQIHIDDEELSVDLFQNIGTLAAYVLQKTAEQRNGLAEGK